MSTIERLIKKFDEQKQEKRSSETPEVSGQSDAIGNEVDTDIGVLAPNQAASMETQEDVVGNEHPVPESLFETSQKKKTIKLDYDHLREAGIITPDKSTEQFRTEFRRIKRPILSNAFGKSASLVDHGNLIMVTSSVPGEGKTFTASNMALSIASERDHTVLLVDADVSKSDLSKLFGLSDEPGLSDLLLDESISIGDVLIKTDIPDFTLLPSGAYHPQMPELMASKRMLQLVNELKERYSDRAVIFDTPPILATSEAPLLLEMSGQIAFVVQAGRTPQYVVQEAISTLDKNNAIGLILNRTQNLLGSSYQGNYYSQYGEYGYGSN